MTLGQAVIQTSQLLALPFFLFSLLFLFEIVPACRTAMAQPVSTIERFRDMLRAVVNGLAFPVVTGMNLESRLPGNVRAAALSVVLIFALLCVALGIASLVLRLRRSPQSR